MVIPPKGLRRKYKYTTVNVLIVKLKRSKKTGKANLYSTVEEE